MKESSEISVDTNEIISTRDEVKKRAEEYKSKYESIYTLADDVVKTYGGDDARKFYMNLKEFKDDFEDIYNSLITYCNFLTKVADAYDNTQEHLGKRALELAENR